MFLFYDWYFSRDSCCSLYSYFFLFALKKQAKDAPFSDVSIIYNGVRLFIKSLPDAKTKFFTNFYEFYNYVIRLFWQKKNTIEIHFLLAYPVKRWDFIFILSLICIPLFFLFYNFLTLCPDVVLMLARIFLLSTGF